MMVAWANDGGFEPIYGRNRKVGILRDKPTIICPSHHHLVKPPSFYIVVNSVWFLKRDRKIAILLILFLSLSTEK